MLVLAGACWFIVWGTLLQLSTLEAITVPVDKQAMYKVKVNGVISGGKTTMTKMVQRGFECGAICSKSKRCTAFSVSARGAPQLSAANTTDDDNSSTTNNVLGHQHQVCTVAYGDFYWEPMADSKLYTDLQSADPPAGYSFEVDGRFYKLRNSTSAVPLRDSLVACESEEGSLAVPHPEVEWNIVKALLSRNNITAAPIGLWQDIYQGAGTWVTFDGVTFKASNNATDGLQRWASVAAAQNSINQCAIMRGPPNAGLWEAVPCTSTIPTQVVCRKTVFGLRDHPVQNGKLYKIVIRGDGNSNTVSQGIGACASNNGALMASLYPASNYKATSGLRAEMRVLRKTFAVGGTDELVEGTWVLPTGIKFVAAPSGTDPDQLWAAGQPNSVSPTEDCILVRPDTSETSQLRDVECYLVEPGLNVKYLCEIE